MKTPPSVIAYRAVASLITALIVLAVGYGLAGGGPLTGLHALAAPLTHALHLDRIGS
jgi:hypothetical protein